MLHALINTLEVSIVGYFIACVLSFVLASFSFHYKFLDNLLGGVIFFLFSSPLIVLVWIIHGSIPITRVASYVFVSMVIIFPMYTHIKRGLKETPELYINTVLICGGNRMHELILVRLKNALPNFASGLQASWSAAFLAAIISDFGSSTQSSLGGYITGAISQGSINQKIEIGFVCTIVGFAGHMLFGIIATYTKNKYSSDKSKFFDDVEINYKSDLQNNQSQFMLIASQVSKYVIWPLVFWYIFSIVAAGTLPAKSPLEVARFFMHSDQRIYNLEHFYLALKLTTLHGIFGLAVVIIIVFILNVTVLLSNAVKFIIDPILIFFQATPIVAWLGILRIIEGPTMISIATAVTASIFPAYIFIRNRMLSPPDSFTHPIEVLGGNKQHVFRYINVPLMINSIPEVVAVSAPRVILGVMLAEYFITYSGLGGLMYENRVGGAREYWWAILLSVGMVSLCFYLLQKYSPQITIISRKIFYWSKQYEFK